MNVLIADDEYLVRASLKSMLLELEMDIRIVGEAGDGEELVRKVQALQPDLVFVDIKMPKMDGLCAIRRLKEQCADTEWIILTGFPVFEYAKESLELQVKNYLLKPVSVSDLKAAVESVQADSLDRRRKRNLELEHDVSALISRYATPGDLDRSSACRPCRYIGILIQRDGFEPDDGFAKLQKDAWNRLTEIKRAFLESEIRVSILSLPDGNLFSVVAWPFRNQKSGRKVASSFLEQLQKSVRQASTPNCCLSLLTGIDCGTFSEISEQLSQMQRMLPLKTGLFFGMSVDYETLAKRYRNSSAQTLRISELLRDMTDWLQNGSYFEYLKSLEQLEYYLKKSAPLPESLAPFQEYLQKSFGVEFCRDPERLFFGLKAVGEKALNRNPATCNIIDQTIRYINANYMLNIGIAQIANQLNVTPNYLSSLFHKKTGESYMNYLTKTRMLKARELLLSADAPHTGQVARQVGYYTVNYFSKLYKEYFGVSPSQDYAKHRSNGEASRNGN